MNSLLKSQRGKGRNYSPNKELSLLPPHSASPFSLIHKAFPISQILFKRPSTLKVLRGDPAISGLVAGRAFWSTFSILGVNIGAVPFPEKSKKTAFSGLAELGLTLPLILSEPPRGEKGTGLRICSSNWAAEAQGKRTKYSSLTLKLPSALLLRPAATFLRRT